jgi:hypothetical protein
MIYEEIVKEITNNIQKCFYNINENDMPNGHRFVAPNGWKVKSIYANGNAKYGSHVLIYENNKDEPIYDFIYFKDVSNPIWKYMEEIITELEKLGVPDIKAIATAEILYATEMINKNEGK